MASRRDIVKGGVALAALTLGPLRAPLARAETNARRAAQCDVDLVIVDRAFPAAGRFALDAAELGYRVQTFEHDVAPIWMNTLEPALRARGLAIAGLTAPGTAFCLETLAAPYRAASFARDEHASGAAARLAPLLRAAASAEFALTPYAHIARAVGDAPAFLTWLIATRG